MTDLRGWAQSIVDRLSPEQFAAALSVVVLVLFALLVLVLARS